MPDSNSSPLKIRHSLERGVSASYRVAVRRAIRIGVCLLLSSQTAYSQTPEVATDQLRCDPAKVITSDGCIKCHAPANQVWKKSPHYKTFFDLHRRPEARAIANRMGLRSIKRGSVCIDCHYTQQQQPDGKLKIVSGVSCESCHGAGKDWVPVHNDYGGPSATRESESAVHAAMRLQKSTELGMRNPHNVFLMARSCLECHTVPNEKLVNVGGHSAGSLQFNFVAWSQGNLRHNFVRTSGNSNAKSDRNRLRLMYVAGLLAELEFSTRATAKATRKDQYGLTVAKRAAATAEKLFHIQKEIENKHVEAAIQAFAKAQLKINNKQQLESIADEIKKAGISFAQTENGVGLAAIDKRLPKLNEYK